MPPNHICRPWKLPLGKPSGRWVRGLHVCLDDMTSGSRKDAADWGFIYREVGLLALSLC